MIHTVGAKGVLEVWVVDQSFLSLVVFLFWWTLVDTAFAVNKVSTCKAISLERTTAASGTLGVATLIGVAATVVGAVPVAHFAVGQFLTHVRTFAPAMPGLCDTVVARLMAGAAFILSASTGLSAPDLHRWPAGGSYV